MHCSWLAWSRRRGAQREVRASETRELSIIRPALNVITKRCREEHMNRHAVSTDHAPAALGPYSQAVVAGGFVFCSGTAGIDPETGSIPEGIEAQTDQALRNLAAILNAAGASMTDLVKTTIFYSDVADFATLNEVYARHMPDPPPARSAPAKAKPPVCWCPSRPSPRSRADGAGPTGRRQFSRAKLLPGVGAATSGASGPAPFGEADGRAPGRYAERDRRLRPAPTLA